MKIFGDASRKYSETPLENALEKAKRRHDHFDLRFVIF